MMLKIWQTKNQKELDKLKIIRQGKEQVIFKKNINLKVFQQSALKSQEKKDQ